MEMKMIYARLCRFFTTFQLVVLASAILAQTAKEVNALDKNIDFEHIDVELTIEAAQKLVRAKVRFDFVETTTRADSAWLSCPRFAVSKVEVDGREASWRMEDDRLIFFYENVGKPSASHSFYIEYEVVAPTELHFVGWDDNSHTRRRQIWAHRPHTWLPYADDRLTMDFRITFDENYQVFNNGIRKEITPNADGTTTWHYSLEKPHPFFSTALVIGQYEWDTLTTHSGLPVELWFYPDLKSHRKATYKFMDEMVDFCENELGVKYPYSIYRQAPLTDYLYGGMETTTSTVFGDYMLIDERAWWERNYVNVNIHELVHQWFGNDISHRGNHNVWLTESFATYYAKRFEKAIFGENAYQWVRLKEEENALLAAKSDDYAIGDGRGGTHRWYSKGSLVFDMLRDEMGDEAFRKAITYYLQKNRQSEVETSDFMQAVSESSGMQLDWFFEQWVMRGGEPHYRIRYEDQGLSLLVKVEQIQEITPEKPPFRANIRFEVGYTDGSRSIHKFLNNSREQLYIIPKEGQQIYLLFDPGNRILKRETIVRPKYDVFDQLLNTPKMIDRYRALVEMRDFPVDEKAEVLQLAWKKNHYHLVRSEIVAQLASDSSAASIAVFRGALTSDHVYVRRAALTNLQLHHKSLLSPVAACLQDSSYSNVIAALRALEQLDHRHLRKYLRQTSGQQGYPGLNVRIVWLETAIRFGRTKYLDELRDYLSPRFDFRTRINAVQAVGRLEICDESIASALVEAALYWNFRLGDATKPVLKAFATHPNLKPFIVEALQNAGTEGRKLEANLGL